MSIPPQTHEPVVDSFGRILAAIVLLLVLCVVGAFGAAVVTIALI
jgi:hypothetical protein